MGRHGRVRSSARAALGAGAHPAPGRSPPRSLGHRRPGHEGRRPGAPLRGRRRVVLPAPHQRVRLEAPDVARPRRRGPGRARSRHRRARAREGPVERPRAGAAGAQAPRARPCPAADASPPGPARTWSVPGDDVDLDALPILTCWPADGGPFITLPQVITRDPETGVRNVGCYRMQKLDRAHTAMHWQVHKTGARHFRRAREMGLRRLEVAVALGGDPAHDLRGDRAAARRDRRVDVRRLPPQARCGHRAVQDRGPRGPGGRRLRPRGLRRPPGGARRTRGPSAITPATTRRSSASRAST